MVFELAYFDTVTGTKAVPIAVRGWHYLLEHDLVDPGAVMLAWDHKAFVASAPGDIPVAVLTFQHIEWKKEFYVNIGFTDVQYRCRGAYKQLWAALVLKAQEMNVKKITATTKIANNDMQSVAEALGRKIVGYYIDFDVPKMAEKTKPASRHKRRSEPL